MDQQDISWMQIRYVTLESGAHKPSPRYEFVKQPDGSSLQNRLSQTDGQQTPRKVYNEVWTWLTNADAVLLPANFAFFWDFVFKRAWYFLKVCLILSKASKNTRLTCRRGKKTTLALFPTAGRGQMTTHPRFRCFRLSSGPRLVKN